jgi:prenyltransferase beta subunit
MTGEENKEVEIAYSWWKNESMKIFGLFEKRVWGISEWVSKIFDHMINKC